MPLTKTQIKDIERYEIMNTHENELIAAGYSYVAGVDEAGRGPLAVSYTHLKLPTSDLV